MAQIISLKENPAYASILAFWAYKEWYLNRALEFDLLIRAFKNRIDDSKMPMSWVAIEDNIPVGMVSLKENDVWSSKDLNPWLSSLYVLPEYRKRSIAKMLLEKVIEKAASFNMFNLYLFTEADNKYLNKYYDNNGWKLLKETKGNDGNIIKIYYYNISD